MLDDVHLLQLNSTRLKTIYAWELVCLHNADATPLLLKSYRADSNLRPANVRCLFSKFHSVNPIKCIKISCNRLMSYNSSHAACLRATFTNRNKAALVQCGNRDIHTLPKKCFRSLLARSITAFILLICSKALSVSPCVFTNAVNTILKVMSRIVNSDNWQWVWKYLTILSSLLKNSLFCFTWSETYFRQDLFPSYLFFRHQFHTIFIFRFKSISDLDSGSLPRFFGEFICAKLKIVVS